VKRKRGRPRKPPPEYWPDLATLLEVWKPAMPGWSTVYYGPPPKPVGKISEMCEHIVKNVAKHGGVKWIDRTTGEIVAEITDPKILRTRFTEAWKKAQQKRQEHQALQRMSPTNMSTFVTTAPFVGPTVMSRSDIVWSSRQTEFQIPARKKLHNK
jgi:hypothetical protein